MTLVSMVTILLAGPAATAEVPAAAPVAPSAETAVAAPDPMEAGWKRLRLGDFSGAREMFAAAAEQRPTSPAPRLALAAVALGGPALDLATAESEAQRAFDLDPSSPDLRASFAAKLRDEGMLAAAEAQTQAALAKFPDHPALLHVLGTIRERRGEADAALRVLQRAAAAAPDDPAIQRDLGLALARSSYTGRAAQLLVAARDRNPGDLEVRRALVAFYQSVKDEPHRSAEEAAVKQLEAVESRAAAKKAALQKMSREIEALEATAGQAGAPDEQLRELWMLYDRRGDMAWNLPRLERVARARGGVAGEAMAALAQIEGGAAEPAGGQLRALAAAHPADPTVLLAVFQAYGRGRDSKRLLDFGKAAVAAAPESAAAQLHLGIALAANGDPTAAETALRKGLRLDPDDVDGLLHLASLLRARGADAEADGLLAHAAKVEPDAPRVFLALGLASLKAGQNEAATRDLVRCEELGGRHPLLFRSLGDLARQRGEASEASRYYRLSLAANPNQPDLKVLLGLLD
jgi:tetratricopeptide (TPR) repeat protein